MSSVPGSMVRVARCPRLVVRKEPTDTRKVGDREEQGKVNAFRTKLLLANHEPPVWPSRRGRHGTCQGEPAKPPLRRRRICKPLPMLPPCYEELNEKRPRPAGERPTTGLASSTHKEEVGVVKPGSAASFATYRLQASFSLHRDT